jgi:RNA polymerase sigma factor (sigma-70 family)
MAATQLATLMRHIKELAAGPAEGHRTDAQLLNDFASRRDDSAFAALVERHGPMVLGVCRRVLRHEQDAEDAFQAAFLILARHHESIRRREALASWLYGVAYRTAMKAKRDAARRRSHEARLRDRTLPAAPGQTWDDVQAVLDEEIQRLPESLRSAFVICILDGKTVPAAAAELGVKKGTLSWRLARARQRLRQRLARRGIHLSAVLAALSLAQGAGATAVPATLAGVTIRFGLSVAAGKPAGAVIPAHVAALAAGGAQAVFLSKTRIAVLILLTGCLLVAGAGGLARQLLAARQQPAAKPKSQVANQPAQPASAPEGASPTDGAKDVKETTEVSGRVVDPDGKAVAGAKVFYARNALAFGRDPPPPTPTPTTADAQGRFRFRVSRTGYRFAEEKADWLKGGVVGVAEGYGPGWAYSDSAENLAGVTIKLIKDVPIEGRVLDLEGKPVAGVSVRVRSYYLGDGDLKAWVEALQARKEGHDVHSMGSMNPAYQLGLARPVVSGADGKFRLTGVGAERVVTLRFEGPTIAISEVYVVTRPCPTVVLPRDKRRPDRGSYVYHGPRFDHVVAPTMPIVGSVRARDTGKPLAGVTIRTQLFSAYGYFDQDHYIRTTTDKDGRYRLVGLPRAAGHYLWVTPAAGQPYLPPERKTAGVSSGLDPLRVDFKLKRGVLIRGRVTDKETGQPVAARVEYFAFADNPHFQARGVLWGLSFHTPTAPDGSFTLVGLPGRGLLAAKSTYLEGFEEGKRYLMDVGVANIKGPIQTHLGPWLAMQFNTVVEINPARDAESIHQDLALHRKKTVTGTVVGPDGKPLAGVYVNGLGGIQIANLSTAEYRLPLHEPLFFYHPDKKLGAAVLFKGDEAKPVTVRLQKGATLTGRLLDQDSRPCAGVQLAGSILGGQLNIVETEGGWFGLFAGKTDREGRFQIDGVLPGVKVGLAINKGGRIDTRLIARVTLKAGQTKDLGDLTKPDKP